MERCLAPTSPQVSPRPEQYPWKPYEHTAILERNYRCPCPLLQVVWETLPGWKSDISGARTWGDLPENAQR
jgi:hypothetical protein